MRIKTDRGFFLKLAPWPQFEERFAQLKADIPQEGIVEVRNQGDVLEEILESVRGMNQRIRTLEASREQTPSWMDARAVAEGVDATTRLKAESIIAEIMLAHEIGASPDVIEEYAAKFNIKPSVLQTLFAELDGREAVRTGPHRARNWPFKALPKGTTNPGG